MLACLRVVHLKAVVGLALGALFLGFPILLVATAADADAWLTLKVPCAWKDADDANIAKHEGFAWYRCFVKVPEGWKGKDLELVFQRVEEADEAFFNGDRVGATGTLPPKFDGDAISERRYKVSGKLVQAGEYYLISDRVYAKDGLGGILGPFHVLRSDSEAIQPADAVEIRRVDGM